MLLTGLHAGFGYPLSAPLIGQAKGLGLDGLRIQMFETVGDQQYRMLSSDERTARVTEVAAGGLIPMVITLGFRRIEEPPYYIFDETTFDGIPRHTNVEIRSEPELWNPAISPADYRRLIEQSYEAAKARELRLWAGTIANLNDRGIEYLRQLHPEDWPGDLPVSIHWYPHGDSPETPHPGFRDRDHEVAVLREIIGPSRAWGVSEFGYHTARRLRFGICPTRWSDEEVREFTLWEWNFWNRQQARFAVSFQVNDGPEDKVEHRFGWRTCGPDSGCPDRAHEWKPVSSSVISFKRQF